MEKRRVVITGLGTVNPLGNNVSDSWAAAKAGKCGIGSITQFDATDFKCKLAGEVKSFDPETVVDKKEARKMARFTLLALAAAREALADKSSFNVNISSDKKAAIAEILRLGTSAGGQRAKAIIAFNKETGEIRSGQAEAPDGFDYYIIKLDGVSATAGFKETENFGRLEYSFSRLVKKCGIEMAECSLIEENGRAHFLTKRFDRINGQKVHMQTLCAIAHFDYRLLRAYSYEQAFTVMRGLRLSYKEAQEMFRRMVFNVVVRNQDDHTKNISFLMDRDGKWRLSPAYDMGYAYNPDGQWTSAHQMSINGIPWQKQHYGFQSSFNISTQIAVNADLFSTFAALD